MEKRKTKRKEFWFQRGKKTRRQEERKERRKQGRSSVGFELTNFSGLRNLDSKMGHQAQVPLSHGTSRRKEDFI